MKLARVLSAWVAASGTGPGMGNHPQLQDDYSLTDGELTVDVTAQPSANLTPQPNRYVLECVLTDAHFAAIAADNTYAILWHETMPDPTGQGRELSVMAADRPRTGAITAAEHAAIHAHLLAAGVPLAVLNALIGAAGNPTHATRHLLERALAAWLKNRPHA